MIARRKETRGSVLLEFALGGTAVLLILFAILDAAGVFQASSLAASAARAGTQYALSSPERAADLAAIAAAAKASAPSGAAEAAVSRFCACGTEPARVDCGASCARGSKQTYLQVAVSTAPPTFLAALGWPVGRKVEASSIVRVE